jgi:plastocyanin
VWDSNRNKALVFAGATTTGNPPVTSYNNVQEYRIEVPYVEEGWLTSAIFDVGGALSVGKISWGPESQPAAVGPGAVKFQVASSSSLETPSEFLGPDGTSDTYFTDPEGTVVGDYHLGAGRIAYRMYFHTDDTSLSPSLNNVDMEVIRYMAKGTYTSPVIDLGQTKSTLDRVKYRQEIPQGTNPNLVKITVRIRTSDNSDMTGASAWEEIEQDDTKFNIPFGQFFQFQAVITTDVWARHLTPVFKGITIEYNSPPELFQGVLDRTTGDRETWFTYAVTYRDVDNDEPMTRLVYIDDEPYEMSSFSLDFVSGAVYTYSTPLALGGHDYYFEFSDGKNGVRDPPAGVYSGPEVLNRAPVPIIDYPAAGTRVTPDEPVEFSASLSSDPDGDDIDYRWTSSIDGLLETHSAFVTKLTEGSHIITLSVTDSKGAMNSTEVFILVKPYLPLLEIKDLYVDKDNPIEKDKVTLTVVVHNTGEAVASRAIIEFMVDDTVADSVDERIGLDQRQTFTFSWTATSDRAFLGVRTRPGPSEDVHDEMYETVMVTPNSPPEVKFSVDKLKVTVGKPVTFMNNGTSDANGDKMTYTWDFGDGTTSTEATTQHIFRSAGTYMVNLTVSDTRGGETNEQFIIVVKKKPKDDNPGFAAVAALLAVGGMAGLEARRRQRRP